jgi:hypothetical protein
MWSFTPYQSLSSDNSVLRNYSYLLTEEDYMCRTHSKHKKDGKYNISTEGNRPVAEITVNGKTILKWHLKNMEKWIQMFCIGSQS